MGGVENSLKKLLQARDFETIENFHGLVLGVDAAFSKQKIKLLNVVLKMSVSSKEDREIAAEVPH